MACTFIGVKRTELHHVRILVTRHYILRYVTLGEALCRCCICCDPFYQWTATIDVEFVAYHDLLLLHRPV